ANPLFSWKFLLFSKPYLSSVLEDDFSYTGIWKGLLLAIPLLALAVSSYIAGKKIKGLLIVMKWVTFTGIVIAGVSVAIISLMKYHMMWMSALLVVFALGASILAYRNITPEK